MKIVYLDIFACRSDRDFYDAFAVLKTDFFHMGGTGGKCKAIPLSDQPQNSLGPDPTSEFSISLELNPKSEDVTEILQFPEKMSGERGSRTYTFKKYHKIANY